MVSNNISRAEFHGSYTRSINPNSEPGTRIVASLINRDNPVCPEGYTRNTNKAADSPQACQTSCPLGTTPDDLSGMCYSCPEGYIRTSADINGVGACKKPCGDGEFEGNYNDGDFGKCYKCPSGYSRTQEPINSEKACFVNCSGFTVKGQCYKCPDGYTQNTSALSPDEACYKPCSGTNIFEYRETQSCYECPTGYIKDPTQNVSPFSSLSCINRQVKPANIVSVVGADGRMVEPKIVKSKVQSVENIIT